MFIVFDEPFSNEIGCEGKVFGVNGDEECSKVSGECALTLVAGK